MSRKSSASLVTFNFRHVAPPLVVRSTVDADPLAHATRSLTALTPRKRAVTPLVCTVQRGAISAYTTTIIKLIVFIRFFRGLLSSRAAQAPEQLRRLRESAIPVFLTFARRLLVARIFRSEFTGRNHIFIRTNLARASRLLARLQRNIPTPTPTSASTHIKLRRFQHLHSSGRSRNRRMISADENSIRRSHRLGSVAHDALRRTCA